MRWKIITSSENNYICVLHQQFTSAKAQRSKWKEMIESTDFTHSSRKACNTINKLTKENTEPQQQCKVTADQVAHQLLLNGKGNKLHVPRREKMPRQTVTESKLTSPFLMEDLLHGVKQA